MTDGFVTHSLDEIRFWARIMKEHSLILKLGFRCNDIELIEEADYYYEVFEEIERKAHYFDIITISEQIKRFNQETTVQVENIWGFKKRLLDLVFTGQLPGLSFLPLFIDHGCREAAYFKNKLEQLNSGEIDPLPKTIMNENIYYLKIMANNVKFICLLLDPSERKLIDQAKEFSQDFDLLLFQALDLENMPVTSQLIDQFLNHSANSVKSLRDFERTIVNLILQNRIKSNIHPLLADQALRETERFLFIIEGYLDNLKQTEQ